MNVLYHLIRADFLERARRYSFLVTLGLALYLGYLVNAGQITLRLDTYRGIFNSAWVGSLMTLVVNFFLGWFGFYLIKNSVTRDYETGVGQIMATTPLRRPLYTLGKWLSNFAVLAVMVVVLMLAALVMQLIQREDAQLNAGALIAPFVLVALPFMALVAAVAVLFETITWLRGGLGNLVYFFGFALFVAFVGVDVGRRVPELDPIGIGLFSNSMREAVMAAYPGYKGGFALGLMPPGTLQTFTWAGVPWTGGILLGRLAIVGLSAAVAGLAAVFFDRFDPARDRGRPAKPVKGARADADSAGVSSKPAPVVWLKPLARRTASAPSIFARALGAELRLMLKGVPWWWYVVALGLIAGGVVSTTELVRQAWLPLAWIWPALLWSPLGNREARWQTGALVFSAARPLARQLPAAWLAGLAVTALAGSGAAVHFVLNGQWPLLAAWAAGLAFIPSLAVALGTWSGTSRLFEVVYVAAWYLGPLNALPALDFTGRTDAALRAGMPLVYLALSVALLAAAIVGRRRQAYP